MTFNNNSSQKERRQVIRNDATTLHDFAQSAAGEISGRWAKPTQVSGSEGAVHMPRLPANSPWSQPDPSGQEKPYPIDLSEPPEPVGTAQEIEDSLQPFSWLRSDGVPQAADSLISASPEPTPDGEVVRGGQAEEPAPREPLTPSGRRSITQRRVSPNPIKRRLV